MPQQKHDTPRLSGEIGGVDGMKHHAPAILPVFSTYFQYAILLTREAFTFINGSTFLINGSSIFVALETYFCIMEHSFYDR
jgi:hypothetical protein